MENVNLIDTFSEFKELKNIDSPTMMSVLEDVFRSMLAKNMVQLIILTLLSISIKVTLKYGETGLL